MESSKNFEDKPENANTSDASPEALPSKDDLAILFEEKKKFDEDEKGKISPIAEGEIFYPEEGVREILRAPKKERPEKLEKFKEKLAFQKEGLAEMQESIVTAIEKDPDAPLEELYGKALEGASKYGITKDQKIFTASVILEYEKRHEKIKEVRNQFPDNKELFRAVFGRMPKGKIEVIEGPVSFYFRCQDSNDYALIYSQKFMKYKEPDIVDVSIARMSSGTQINTSLIPGLEGAIIAERAEGLRFYFKKAIKSESIHAHEKEHVKQSLIKKADIAGFVSEKFIKENMIIKINSLMTVEEKEKEVKKFLRHRRLFYDERSKNEILAFLKEGIDMGHVLEKLISPLGIYRKDMIVDKIAITHWLFSNSNKNFIMETIIQGVTDDVYIKEYDELLKDGITSLEKLINSGYSKDKAIALLMYEPLSRWGKTVNRVLKEGKNNLKSHPKP